MGVLDALSDLCVALCGDDSEHSGKQSGWIPCLASDLTPSCFFHSFLNSDLREAPSRTKCAMAN